MINTGPITPDESIPRRKTMEFNHSTISYDYTQKELTVTTEQEAITLDLDQLKELHAALKGLGLAVSDHTAVNYR